MKITTLLLISVFLLWLSYPIYAQDGIAFAIIDKMLSLSSAVDRQQMERQIVNICRAKPNDPLQDEAFRRLKDSLAQNYSTQNRRLIVELNGHIHSRSALLFFVSYMTKSNPGPFSGGSGKGSFEAEYPYAAGLIDYGSDSLPAILAEEDSSNDPDNDHVSYRVIGYLYASSDQPFIEQYCHSTIGSKSAALIVRFLKSISVGNEIAEQVNYLYSHETDLEKRNRLLQLKVDMERL